MPFEQFDTRELFARLVQCEAGGEGENGMTVPSYLLIHGSLSPHLKESQQRLIRKLI